MALPREGADAELLRELRQMMPMLRGLVDDAAYRQRRGVWVNHLFSRGRVVLVTMIALGMFVLQAATLWTSSHQHTAVVIVRRP